jgi:hypothetical protein
MFLVKTAACEDPGKSLRNTDETLDLKSGKTWDVPLLTSHEVTSIRRRACLLCTSPQLCDDYEHGITIMIRHHLEGLTR